MSFDGTSTDRTWRVTNDPVMGGRSESTFTKVNNTGVFDGINKIVPSLDAPGFCNAAASLGGEIDLSAYVALLLLFHSNNPFISSHTYFKSQSECENILISLARTTCLSVLYSHVA